MAVDQPEEVIDDLVRYHVRPAELDVVQVLDIDFGDFDEVLLVDLFVLQRVLDVFQLAQLVFPISRTLWVVVRDEPQTVVVFRPELFVLEASDLQLLDVEEESG